MVHSSLNQQKDQLILSDIEDPDPSDSIIEDQPVTFDIVEDGTNRRASKLVSSDGYSYTVKKSGARTTNWRCCVRNKSVWCKATVIQKVLYLYTDFLNCEDFLVGDVIVGTQRHVMFATQQQLDLLKNARRWYLDGTFKVVQKPFTQLFSIHAFAQKDDCVKQVPLCFVLMSSRQKKDYTAVFSRLVQLIPDNRVQAFCLDFESGAWAAIKAVFPDTEIKGCAFHWGQAVMRKVANLGLKSSYNAKKGIHIFVRKLLALPYLPADHIRPAFNIMIRETTSIQLQLLINYLTNTWLNNPTWSVQQWSVPSDGWHHRFIGKAGGSNLHFYKLVPALMKEARSVGVTVHLVEEQSLRRYQRVTFRKSQGRLAELWDKYELASYLSHQNIRLSTKCWQYLCNHRTNIPGQC